MHPVHAHSPACNTRAVDSACNRGRFAVDAAAECSACATDTFANETNNSACRACPAHTRALPASKSLQACVCAPGFFGPDGKAACSECAAGTFNTLRNQVQCAQCHANSSTPRASARAVNCTCNAGFFGADDNVCVGCLPGAYKDFAGAGACVLCPPHTFSLGNTSASRGDCGCDAGYTNLSSGVDHKCVACALRHYKDAHGISACTVCHPDSTTAGAVSTGLAACLCVPGFAPRDGLCSACAPDTFKSSTPTKPARAAPRS